MRGRLESIDRDRGEGLIVGDHDRAHYTFSLADVRSAGALTPGQAVEFVATEGLRATEVIGLRAEVRRQAASGGDFDIGRVIQRTFTSISQNWAIFLGASIILVGIPSTVAALGQGSLLTAPSSSSLLFILLGTLLYLVGLFILQGMVVKAAVNGFNGRSTRFGDAFGIGIMMFLPLLGLGIVAGLGMALGYLLLIVPGLILSVLWSVAAPAVVVEKRGVFEALQRSRDLTRGHRWSVFGLIVIYVLLSWVIGLAIGALSVVTGGTFTEGTPNVWVNLVSGPIVNILSGVVASAGVAALYYELRVAKEGAGPEELASVFD